MQLSTRETGHSFRIKFNGSTGTAFLFGAPGGACFVSAAHVLQGAIVGDIFELQKAGNQWHQFPISEIQFSPDSQDVCVFATDDFAITTPLLPHPIPTITLGDKLAFVGFPHDLFIDRADQYFATAMVRVAHFSGVVSRNGISTIILDGFNNPGYSGSPVYGQDRITGQTGFMGVVSGYLYEHLSHSAVYTVQNGQMEPVAGLFVRPNSGMINVVGARAVLDLAGSLTRYLKVEPAPAEQQS